MKIILSKEKLREKLMNSQQLSLVFFKNEMNDLCRSLYSVFREIASDYRDTVNFFLIDVEYETEIDYAYNVLAVPTVLFFRQGVQVERLTGQIDKTAIMETIEKHVKSALR